MTQDSTAGNIHRRTESGDMNRSLHTRVPGMLRGMWASSSGKLCSKPMSLTYHSTKMSCKPGAKDSRDKTAQMALTFHWALDGPRLSILKMFYPGGYLG